MIGTRYTSEMSTYTDSKTGMEIVQLTNSGINCHLYFTDNSFNVNGKEIYFLSNKGNPEKEICNLFHMDLDTGEMIQLTDEEEGIMAGDITKTPDGKYIAYFSNKELHLYNTETCDNKVIYKEESMMVNTPSFSSDLQWIGFVRNEDISTLPKTGGANYAGFKERMFATKDGRVSMIRLDGTEFQDVFRDTHWISHFQCSPDDSNIAMFCHEGPWNYVQQRIWMIDVKKKEVWPCFRQEENDCVGHEFWLQNGDILFDNRRGGHDGTISSTKEQVYASEQISNEIPYFGFANKQGEMYRNIEMPYYCNHYHANPEVTMFVGDAIDDIILMKQKENGELVAKTIAVHNTTWKYQRSHCHPTFSWDGNKILYAADTDRWHGNLFLIDISKCFEDEA